MKEYDFLFVYEVKNRELENICLLKYELERRGYSVKIVETWRRIHYYYPKVKAKVIIAFALYSDRQINSVLQFSKGGNKILNLQWEQLYAIAEEEDTKGSHTIKQNALWAVHVSWGKYNYDRLKNISLVPEDNLCLAGHITMDFLKPRLKGYYLDKEELYRQFDIDVTKKVILFISSFSYVDIPDMELEAGSYAQLAYSAMDFKKISILSQRKILQWMDRALEENADKVIIYRPHPAETGNEQLVEMEKKHPNFKVIREYSIKQWILAADDIYTWYSTSVAEVYAAGKSCHVLRPIDMPRESDIRIYENCISIKTQEKFLEALNDTDMQFPFDLKMLNYYYKLDDEYAYEIICDKLETMLKSSKYEFDFRNNSRKKRNFVVAQIINLLNFVERTMKLPLKRAMAKIDINNGGLIGYLAKHNEKLKKDIEYNHFVSKMIKNNYVSDEEIERIQKKIASVLEHNM